ncbi:MAG TPA: HEAT repeat domain-containing protein [Candidatus Acidoferrum sp.]|jgi:hypothetical protein
MDETKNQRELSIKRHKEALAELMRDLRVLGYDMESLDSLRRSGIKYDSAIPVLLDWLPRVSLPDAKESIVRTLSVPWAKPSAGPILLKEFANAPTNEEWYPLRWAIGNAIEVVVEAKLLPEIIEIVSNPENGTARRMFVLALGKIRDPRSVPVLIKLLEDQQVAGHAIVALRKLRAPEALNHLERFVDHPMAWVRKEAKKAIASIMKNYELS